MPNKVFHLLVFSLILFSSCSKNAEKKTETSKEERNTFSFIGDFSNQQGFRGWNYYYGDIEEPKMMIYDIDFCVWRGLDFYSYVEIGTQHPGNNTDTILSFTASKKGKLSITGSIHRNPETWSGDGVFFYIVGVVGGKVEEDFILSQTIGGQQKEPFNYDFERNINKGDSLYFVVNGNKENSYDQVSNDIVIEYK